MDDRIRAAQRSGDRQRLLIELHRAGRELTYQIGDRVRIRDWPNKDQVLREIIIGREGVVVVPATSYYGFIRVRIEGLKDLPKPALAWRYDPDSTTLDITILFLREELEPC